MYYSVNPEPDDIDELVERDELADLSDFSYREGLDGGRDIVYREESMSAWISAEYSIDLLDEL